jgi:hypothetical protein
MRRLDRRRVPAGDRDDEADGKRDRGNRERDANFSREEILDCELFQDHREKSE